MVLYAFVRMTFKNASVHRVDFWISLLSVFVLMYTSYSLWSILYRQQPDAFGMDLERMTTYGTLGMLLVPAVHSAAMAQHYIAQQVRMGTLEVDLIKPIGFLFHMLCRNFGEFCVQLLTRSLPGFVFAYAFLGLKLPADPVTAVAFLISLLLGYLIFFAINVLMGLVAVVTLDIRSYTWAFQSLVRFASGYIVPLWIFPPALGAILTALPFKDMYYVPLSIYISGYSTGPLLSQAA